MVMSNLANIVTNVVASYTTVQINSIVNLGYTVSFLVLFSLFIPESPYYLVISKKVDKAENALKSLRRSDDVKEELGEIVKTVEQAKIKKVHTDSWKEIFKSKAVRRSLLIVTGLLFFNQMSGNVPMSLFTQQIFNATKGSEILSSIGCSIVTNVVQFLTTLIISRFMDYINRRLLLFVGNSGAAVSLFSLGTYFCLQSNEFNMESIFWVPILSAVFYFIFCSISLGPMPFIMAGETFPSNHLKTYLNGTAFTFYICLGFALSFFPSIQKFLGMTLTFYIFTGFTLVSIVFVYFIVPETRNKKLIEIQEMLEDGRIK